jgi:hypothetical protein
MERTFYDTENDEYITITQLENEYNELKANGNTEAETFKDYINNCMWWNNGALKEVV